MSEQSLYTYVWNNPTNLTDPTGFLTAQETAQALKSGTAQATLADGTIVGLKATFNADGSIATLTVTLPGESTTKTLTYNGTAAGSTLTLVAPNGVTTAREATLAAVAKANGSVSSPDLAHAAVGLVPVVGSGRESIDAFKSGHWIYGTIFGALAIGEAGTLGELELEDAAPKMALEHKLETKIAEDAAQLEKPVQQAAKEGEKGLTTLYQKVGPNGEHLKYGITKNPATRYTEEELAGGRLKTLATGPREDMLQLERNLHETLPIGPEEGQKFYIQKQIDKGLTPPPYK